MEIYNVGNNSVNLHLLKSATHNLLIVALELNNHKSIEDWENLRKLGAKKIFPSHYDSYEVELLKIDQ